MKNETVVIIWNNEQQESAHAHSLTNAALATLAEQPVF